ncbi:hypothetical protein SMICM304S_08795 [Streptomyces microflavus]
MTAGEMDRLEKASGKAFDTAFMEMMIKHHEGAVAMAKTEKTDGAFPDAKKMADAIITSQTAEITRMNDLPRQELTHASEMGVSSAGAGPRTPPARHSPSLPRNTTRGILL